MEKIKIFVDSTSDLDEKTRMIHNIGFLPMTFYIDKKQYDADLDWNNISPSIYYKLMRNGERAITGQVKPGQFENEFENYLKDGYDVLYIGCSSKLSGSLNYAKIVALDLKDKYPKNKIICFDSLRSNCAQGLMAIDASILVEQGRNLREITNYLLENRLKYQSYAIVGTLEWFRKAGRVKTSTALLSDILGVKPIIYSDCNGNNTVYKSIKGRDESIQYLSIIIHKRLEKSSAQTVYIEHADCLDDAEKLRNSLLDISNIKRIVISDLGQIIGATTGPDSIVVSFYGKKVSTC